MSDQSIRFCVSDGVLRAASWKCWSPAGKNDVYLACREFKGAMKASLHASGKWHVAYDPTFHDKAVPTEHKSEKGRFIDKWAAPAAPDGYVLAFRVVTPWSAMRTPGSSLGNLTLVPNATVGKAVEFDILLVEPTTPITGWPGKTSMKSQLVGSYALPNKRTVWVVHREIDMPKLAKQTGKPKFYEGKSEADLKGGNLKMIALAVEPDGSRTYYDLPVTYGAENE